MQHVWTIYYKNAHPRERRSIEIDEKENFGDSVIDIFPRKITNAKTNYDGNGLHLFSILKSLRLPRAIFQRDHLGLLQCKNPVYITCFSRALETVRRVSVEKFFILFE